MTVWYVVKCLDCRPVVERRFGSYDEQQSWIGPHIDITRHRIKSWEEDENP